MNPEGSAKVLVLGDAPRITARSESGQRSIVLFGNTIASGRTISEINQPEDWANDPVHQVRQLNGEFVVLVETTDRIVIANDRFAAIPVFYTVENRDLVLSFSYQAIWRRLKERNLLKPDSLAFYEFLHFQRLFGTTTLDESTKTLPPASCLSLDKITGAIETTRYWKPNFTKRNDGLMAIAADLAEATRASVSAKTSDKENVALLLSGGMDSRVVLGGFDKTKPPHCVTVGDTENNEVDVAKSLARITGADHSFVQRSPSHYADILSQSSASGGCMYLFEHGHFFNLEFPSTDLILHGHGFDYFFQGMYLPSQRRRLLGRPTRSWSLEPIPPDIPGEYLQKASYRLKGIDSSGLLKPEFISQAEDRLRSDLEGVLETISGETSEPYDDWDYLTTSAPGRHYTYLNLLSANSLAEQRTISFDNDIFDIYYSTPAIIRHGTRLLAETIKCLNPKLLEVRNANTNLRPDLSPTSLTIKAWTRGTRRRMHLGGSTLSDPTIADRSWPTSNTLLQGSQALRDRVENLQNSEAIESLEIFDLSKIRKLVEAYCTGSSSVAPALLSLVTIDEFLRSSGGRRIHPNMP